MSTFRFVADVHIGNHKQFGGETKRGINSRAQKVLGVLGDVAVDSGNNKEQLVVLGDLFDTSHPTPQLVAETMRALKPAWDQPHLLLGNHDMVSADKGDNALVPLAAGRNPSAIVYDTPHTLLTQRRDGDMDATLMVPFRPEPMHEWFAETVGTLLGNLMREPKVAYRTLCFHGGVRDHNTPKYLWTAPDSISRELLFDIMKRGTIDKAFCGNWHSPKKWVEGNQQVYQVGTLAPTGFDNEGWDYGYSVALDEQRNVKFHIHYGPRFVKTSRQSIQRSEALFTVAEQARRVGNGNVHWRYELAEGETQEEAQALMEKVELAPWAGLAFTQTEEETEQQEAEAAEAARVSDNLDENLRGYVEAMPLPEGVEREAVHSLVNRYIGRG